LVSFPQTSLSTGTHFPAAALRVFTVPPRNSPPFFFCLDDFKLWPAGFRDVPFSPVNFQSPWGVLKRWKTGFLGFCFFCLYQPDPLFLTWFFMERFFRSPPSGGSPVPSTVKPGIDHVPQPFPEPIYFPPELPLNKVNSPRTRVYGWTIGIFIYPRPLSSPPKESFGVLAVRSAALVTIRFLLAPPGLTPDIRVHFFPPVSTFVCCERISKPSTIGEVFSGRSGLLASDRLLRCAFQQTRPRILSHYFQFPPMGVAVFLVAVGLNFFDRIHKTVFFWKRPSTREGGFLLLCFCRRPPYGDIFLFPGPQPV